MLADAGVPQNPELPAFVNPYANVRNRVAELERAQIMSEHGSDHGKGVQRFLDERDWELQSARARVQELESLIKRQGSRTSFESAVSKDPQTPPGLPAATLHSRPMSIADPLHEWYANSVHDPYKHAHVSDAPPPQPPAPPHSGDDDSSSSDESEVKRKKKKRRLYKVKNAEMLLPQYSNTLTLQSWRRAVRMAAVSLCEKPEWARAFVFSVESEDASFDALSVSDSDKHRALDANLAEALLKIVKGDLARRFAVMSETLAKRGLVLAGR